VSLMVVHWVCGPSSLICSSYSSILSESFFFSLSLLFSIKFPKIVLHFNFLCCECCFDDFESSERSLFDIAAGLLAGA